MEPRPEALGVTQPRELPPRDEERLLNGILGLLRVAKDPVRDRIAEVAVKVDELTEGDVVALLRPFDQPRPHLRLSLGARPWALHPSQMVAPRKRFIRPECGSRATRFVARRCLPEPDQERSLTGRLRHSLEVAVG